ncbi:hypothetical protein MCEMSEM23_01988 [Rhabdaerophilaceae bacterium]
MGADHVKWPHAAIGNTVPISLLNASSALSPTRDLKPGDFSSGSAKIG